MREQEERQFKELTAFLKPLWEHTSASYSLIHFKDKNKRLVFGLYIFMFTLNEDGTRTYQKPIKVYKRYESMKHYLTYLYKTIRK